MKNHHQIKAILAGLILSSSVVPAVMADDIEIYTTPSAAVSSTNPNILFIVDNSGSMSATSLVREDYDESGEYAGGCQRDGIYFVDNGDAPDCNVVNEDWFYRSALVCDHALVAYSDAGVRDSAQPGPLGLIGSYSDQLAQFNPETHAWTEVQIRSAAVETGRDFMVECLSDSGIHGASTSGGKYIENGGAGFTGTVPAELDVPHAVWSGGAGNLQLFDGNYLNYLNDNTVAEVEKTRLEQVKRAVEILVRGNTQVDIGLMVFDTTSSPTTDAWTGGSVIHPVLDVATSRSDFFSALEELQPRAGTQLSETYYEALMYYGGKAVTFAEHNDPAVDEAAMEHDGDLYSSPITGECDRNVIVVLSDGSPTADDVSVERQKLLSSSFDAGSCSTAPTGSFGDDNLDVFLDTTDNLRVSTVDNCLDELAGWAYNNDVAVISTNSAHDGVQKIITHTIGFELEPQEGASEEEIAAIKGAEKLLKDTAKRGGGKDYMAAVQSELIDVFNKITADTLEINSTFSSPAVSVNAFNRSTHLDDLYFTLFEPAMTNRWNGNLKKYKLDFETDAVTKKVTPFIADKLGNKAVDPDTGLFVEESISFWSAEIDGEEVIEGGAASVLTATRNVYTFTGTYAANTNGVYQPSDGTLIAQSNAVDPTNASLTDALLGTTLQADIVEGSTYRETVIDWASGLDALGEFGGEATDQRPQMGDPLHAEPALVQYGETAGAADLVAYVATNDGYLHAFDVNTGLEIFSFIPQELLTNLPELMENNRADKTYGLDGSVVAWVNDVNKDGTISGAGEHVYLYIGMRRGGNNIYSLDVTNRNEPKLRWVIKGGSGDYTELGQTWSSVNVEKIKDGGAEKTVLIFGGGYDTAQDGAAVRTPDSAGRAVYIADAETGVHLWSAGKDGVLATEDMEYSIPARIKPLDINGDGFIDRLYAADTGGQVFRYDIDNTNAELLRNSITGGKIIDIAGADAIDNRRFYYPPDVALVDAPDGKYHALLLSSGYRAHPLNDVIHDRIYMIKDRSTGLAKNYDMAALTEADLHNVTANLAGGDSGAQGNTGADASRRAELAKIADAEGWYIDLEDEDNPGSWIGEKGLAEALIIEGVAMVSTYTPNIKTTTDICGPNEGLGKVFFLDILDATPAFPSNVDVRQDRQIKLVRGGIPPSPGGIITKGGEPTICVGTECQAADLGMGVRKTYWYEVEK